MKNRITITLDEEVLKFIDSMIENRVFANRSHCFEFLIQREINKEHGVNVHPIFKLK